MRLDYILPYRCYQVMAASPLHMGFMICNEVQTNGVERNGRADRCTRTYSGEGQLLGCIGSK